MDHPRHPLHSASLDRLALLWSALVSAILCFVFRSWGFDDPFITYRYAANLARGAGFVYNQGERVLSTTAPLYAILLSPAAALGLDLPLVSNLIGCFSLGMGALALWRLARASAMPVAGAVALLLYPLAPQLMVTLGAETTTFIALTLWGFVALSEAHPRLSGLLLALATLVRADAALAALVAGVALLLRREIRPLVRLTTVYLLVVAPFALAAWAYFGSPLPATFGAKRSQGLIPGSRSYLQGLVAQLNGLIRQPLFWSLLFSAPLGFGASIWRRPALALPLVWGGLHALCYSLLGVTAYFWYYGPALLALTVSSALGLDLLASWLRIRTVPWAGMALAATLALAIGLGEVQALASMTTRPDQRLGLYREVGSWLRTHTAPEARVATLEVGIIGFYAERPIIDFAGLIQPEVSAVFQRGESYDAAARWAIATYHPDYIANQEQAIAIISADPALGARCHEVAAFPDPRFPKPFTIYRCEWTSTASE